MVQKTFSTRDGEEGDGVDVYDYIEFETGPELMYNKTNFIKFTRL